MATTGGMISYPLFEQAVAAAVRAPSMYNVQPWRFRLDGNAIEIRADKARSLPVGDPDGWGARLALGAAACNIRLTLATAGLASALNILPTGGDPRVEVTAVEQVVGSPHDHTLFQAIAERFSHRGPFGPQPVPAPARAHLQAAAVDSRAWIELLDDRARISRVAEILDCADQTLRRDPAYVAELHHWADADASRGEGIAGPAAGLRPESQDLLPMRDFGGRARADGRDFESDPLLGVLGTVGGEHYDDVVAGHALQRVLLTATADGLCSSMLSQAIEVGKARAELREALGHYGVPQMVIRFGYGQPLGPSPRRPVGDVID